MAECYDRLTLLENYLKENMLQNCQNGRLKIDSYETLQYLESLGGISKDSLLKLIMPTFYHGTDERIVSMDYNARMQLRKAIQIANDYLWSLYKERWNASYTLIGADGFAKEQENLKNQVIDAVSCAYSNHRGSSLYTYETDGLYLTTLPLRARILQ